MKRTTVELPDDLDTRLHQEAVRRQTTVTELAREAIEAYLRPEAPSPPVRYRKLISGGAGDSGRSDISQKIDEILREELGRFPSS